MSFSLDTSIRPAEELLELAKFQLPGVTIVVGPEFGYLKQIEQVTQYKKYPDWQTSLWHYDFLHEHGWLPSLMDMYWASVMQFIVKRELTIDEWTWIHKASLKEFTDAMNKLAEENNV